MEENLPLSTRQKKLGVLLLILFIITMVYYVYTKTTWFPFGRGLENAIADTEFVFPASIDKPFLKVVLICDSTLPECKDQWFTLTIFQETHPNDITFSYSPYVAGANGRKAALALLLSAQDGKGEILLDRLFDYHDEWIEVEDPTDLLVNFATEIGYDETAFKDALMQAYETDSAENKTLNKALKKNESINISSSTVFINNKKHDTLVNETILTNKLADINPLVDPIIDDANLSVEEEPFLDDFQLDVGLYENFQE